MLRGTQGGVILGAVIDVFGQRYSDWSWGRALIPKGVYFMEDWSSSEEGCIQFTNWNRTSGLSSFCRFSVTGFSLGDKECRSYEPVFMERNIAFPRLIYEEAGGFECPSATKGKGGGIGGRKWSSAVCTRSRPSRDSNCRRQAFGIPVPAADVTRRLHVVVSFYQRPY